MSRRLSDGQPPKGNRESRSRPELGELHSLVGSLREGDGVDPREEAKRRRRAAKLSQPGHPSGWHQQERFLGQIQMAIDSALRAASTPILNEVSVREVVQEGGALLVVVAPRDPDKRCDLRAVEQALGRAASMLRREVAATITRKATPNLRFVVLPAGAEKAEGSGGDG